MKAVKRGEFPGEIVDQALRRHLRVKMLLGLFDSPYVDAAATGAVFDTPEQRTLALEAARRTMTLLKNDDGLLPLSKDLKSVAVIGPNADCTHALLGDYSYSVYRKLDGDAVKIVSILEGIRNKASAGTRVLHAPGCGVMDESTEGFAEAIRMAKEAEVVIAVVGGRSAIHKDGTSGENIDRAELGLPGAQEGLLRELVKTGKPVVAVLANGRPLAIEWAAGNVPAILEAWLPGEEGGTAVADVLFGDYNPGGKLPVSLLRKAGQAPAPYRVSPSSRAKSAQYAFTSREPVYPFGHGLSYTEFGYSDLKVEPGRISKEDSVRITCTVKNTGTRAGDEVAQLYVRDTVASVVRPRKELKGFCRLTLEPGEKKKLTFMMPVELLSLYNREMKLVVEPGEFEVMVGSSSEDIRLEGRLEISAARDIGSRRVFRTEVTIS